MGLGKLASRKVEAETVLGVDASTNSFAFCVYDKNGPVRWGEIKFKGSSVFERLVYGGGIIRSLVSKLDCDIVAIEASVYVNNKSTVIGMAYSVGMIISSLGVKKVVEYRPLEWQSYIGNPPLKKAEKEKIRADYPGKTDSWYSNKGREFRKNRTREWVMNTFGYNISSDNVTDAFGIAAKAWSEHGRE